MTPFDTALRVQRREVDAVKVSISVEIETITTLNSQAHAHDLRMREERALAAIVPIASDAWRLRMKAERARLDHQAQLANVRLTSLRAQAVEAYGTMRAIEGAAGRFKDEAERVAAGAEQSMIDDIAAAKLVIARRNAERSA
ncbi:MULTISPECIES: hypothetical protein [Sphingomonas]|uniref:Flagellar export protein FliJ n=1 Tax=Sphingomonas kyeonggiensis TaxID=1268553 RepID=A0A7W7K3R6_9SPHN|nr:MULTISPECIES: hypothetical protein [Sphingomonas]MBB4840162.1 hypothetical protein [Sphingomonas kyeonggiensis]WHU04792.1 hypothetical protein O3305_09440 [Sphingomonas sp. NIBR02145]